MCAVANTNLTKKTFLVQHIETPANFNHANDKKFKQLTAECAKGNADAMYALADWFEKMSHRWFASKFYVRAANYWRYRAFLKGQKYAVLWFERYFAEHPDEQLESIISESSDHRGKYDYHHDIPGKLLNDLGFDFFDPNRKYDIRKLEHEDIVEVSAFASYEGPDEDGFGDEWNYDWWFLDENMQPIPGIKKLYGEVKEIDDDQFRQARAKAAQIIKQRRD